MSYSSRFWLYAPVSLFLLLVFGAAVHWYIITDAFAKRLLALKGHSALPGVILNWNSMSIAGFPFRVDAEFSAFEIKGAGAHGPFSWRTQKFALHALTYGRTQAVFEAAGPQQLTWTDSDRMPHKTDFFPAALRASAICDRNGLARFDLDIMDSGARDFTIGRLQFHMRRDPNGSDLDLMLRADSVTGFGPPQKLVQVYATLNKERALASLLNGTMSWPMAIARWHGQGGWARLSQIVAPGFSPDKLLSPLY